MKSSGRLSSSQTRSSKIKVAWSVVLEAVSVGKSPGLYIQLSLDILAESTCSSCRAASRSMRAWVLPRLHMGVVCLRESTRRIDWHSYRLRWELTRPSRITVEWCLGLEAARVADLSLSSETKWAMHNGGGGDCI